MPTAFLFAGQGAQKVGMAKDLAGRYGEVSRLLDEAEDAASLPLKRMMFDGPDEALRDTAVQQPAVLAASVAAMKAAELDGRLPTFTAVAGLSLGEYSACCAAEAIPFADAVRLVKRRGELMKEACSRGKSGMISVLGLDEESCRKACEEAKAATDGDEVLQVANLNCPGQVVIAGEIGALEAAGKLCKEMGARRLVPLKVAGAFHTPLMAPAAEGLKAEMERVEFRDPRVPVVQNCCAEKTSSASLLKERLIGQLTSTVLWEKSMRLLLSEGVDSFVEFGPGRTLAGLLRRIDGSARVTSVSSSDDIASLPLT